MKFFGFKFEIAVILNNTSSCVVEEKNSGLDSAVQPEDGLHFAEQSSRRRGVHGLGP